MDPPAHPPHQPDSFLLAGLLDRISELMGDAVSSSAFRYAAFEEGRRIGSGYRPDELERLLERLDVVLGQHSHVLKKDDGAVHLRVEGSRMLDSDRDIVRGIAVGVLEGALLACQGRRFTGRLDGQDGDAVVVVLEGRQDG